MAWLLLKPGATPVIHFFPGEDKVAHFVLFMGWSFLMTLRGLYTSIDHRLILTVAIVIALIIGAGTEILQGIIPNRSRDMIDFIADAIGTLSGTAAALVFYRVFLNS